MRLSPIILAASIAFGLSVVPAAAAEAATPKRVTKTVTGIGMATCPKGYVLTGGGQSIPKTRTVPTFWGFDRYVYSAGYYSKPLGNSWVADAYVRVDSASWRDRNDRFLGLRPWDYGSWKRYDAKVYAVCLKK